MFTSEAITRDIRVHVQSKFCADRSAPEQGLWFFVYHILIQNEGEETVQLVSRHWFIEDATGKVEEVSGPGVVGEQPVLEPGQGYEYTSACPLETPYGNMKGSYLMVSESGDEFEASIAKFALIEPQAIQ